MLELKTNILHHNMGKHNGPVLVYHAVKSQRISDTLWVWTTITIKPPNLGTYLSICNMMESTTTAEQQNIDCSKWGLYLNTTVVDTEIKKSSCLPLEDLRRTGISTKIVLSPLPTLKWGLGRAGSWLHPFGQSGTLPAPELPYVGPAFPPGVLSLFQSMT